MAQTVQIVITARWPLYKSQEVGNRFTKVIQEKGPSPAINSIKAYHTSNLNGWQNTIFHEVELDKVGEALAYLVAFNQEYFDIEGYTFEISFAVTGEELAAYQAGQQG